MKYSIVRYIVQYGTVRYSTAQYGTARYGMVEHSTVQYSAVLDRAVQYSIKIFFGNFAYIIWWITKK